MNPRVAKVVLLVLFFQSTFGSRWIQEECGACDYNCENSCSYYCGFGYHVTYYSCITTGSSSYPQAIMNCECGMTVPMVILLSILPLVATIWLVIATAATGFFIRNAIKRNTNYLALVQPKKEEFIVGRASIPHCYAIFTNYLAACSCCSLLPFIVIDNLNLFFTRFHFVGERITFTGRATTYCAEVFCVNFWMNFVTCGCWSCFGFASDRLRTWIDKNSQLQNPPTTQMEPVYLFRSRPPLPDRVVAFFGTCLSCGILAPFFFVRDLKTTVAGWRVNSQRAIFTGTSEEFAGKVCIPACLFSWVSCGMYNLLGFKQNRVNDWVDSHLRVVPDLPPQVVHYAQHTPTPQGPQYTGGYHQMVYQQQPTPVPPPYPAGNIQQYATSEKVKLLD